MGAGRGGGLGGCLAALAGHVSSLAYIAGMGAMALALAGLVGVRTYDNQLIRQTESELIAQGAVIAAAYRATLEKSAPDDYGHPRTAPWPWPAGSMPAG